MSGEDTPAQHKSSESVTDADVQHLVNQLLRFPLTTEHDDAQDVFEGAVQLAWSSAQAGPDRFWWAGAGIEGIYVNDFVLEKRGIPVRVHKRS